MNEIDFMTKKRIDLIKFIKNITPKEESDKILKYIKHWLRDTRKEGEKDITRFISWSAYGNPNKEIFEIEIDLKTKKIVEVIALVFNYKKYI